MRLRLEMDKLKIGIFALTSCQGCMWNILNLEHNLIELMKIVNIANFELIKKKNEEGPFDVALIEGCITTEEEQQQAVKIREKSKFIIAFGTCATYGGVPTIRNFLDLHDQVEALPPNPLFLKQIAARGIDAFIKVDYFMRGCPIDKKEFINVMKDLVVGKKPKQITHNVCFECRQKENICLLQKGEPCMGPITYAGCNALCPSHSTPCYGCFGPMEDANLDAEIEQFKKCGLTTEDIKRYFRTFAGTSKVFKKFNEDIKK
ncbi:oxidoreductase [Candidatus Woesearchaeota archaeon]|nr:oxidoreductase [Candidatus Woesearchaeota archaeon]